MKSARFDIAFLVIGLIVQVLTYWLAPTHPMALVSGLLGITSVILCSQGNIWTFVFGFGQILTYSYLCYLERFYAGLAMNAFYFLSQIYGIYAWRRLRTGESAIISPRSLPIKSFVIVCAGVAVVAAGVGWMLAQYTDDTQPYMDALTTVVSVVAQVMLVMAIRQQWWLWLVVDVLFVAMWVMAGNWSMVMQYGFWCVNCVYGLIRWRRLAESPSNGGKIAENYTK